MEPKGAYPLDDEERELEIEIATIDTTKHLKPTKALQKKLKAIAKETIKQQSKMNIRIDPDQLNAIKKRADREGLKYQSFVKSVLHKYVTGQLVEKKLN